MAKSPADLLAEYRALAAERGGELLADRWLGSNTYVRWRCAEGHEWETKAQQIRRGTWCPRCAGRHRYTIEDMRELAHERGGECLSDEYRTTLGKLWWRCAEGHEWETTPNTILGGCWCPRCRRRQPDIRKMQEHAKAIGGQCLSERYINKNTKLRWQCAEGHEWDATPGHVINSGSWCPYCAGNIVTIDDIRAAAAARGGRCISTRYRGSSTKLLIECGEGHRWRVRPAELRAGSWCPVCAGTQRLTLTQMRNVAKSRGGKCLSRSYTNMSIKLRWRCASGHEWQAKPLHVIHNKSWCPYCAGRASMEEMQAFAKAHGGRCISRKVGKTRERLRWKCSAGHRFERTPMAIRQGRWCPRCD